MNSSVSQIAKLIDHSVLGPRATDADIRAGAELGRVLNVASVCVKPYAAGLVAKILQGSAVAPCVTIGFPHGANATMVKVFESRVALDEGARELDMVVNLGKVLAGEWQCVADEVAAVAQTAHGAGAIVKVIFETCWLNPEQKIRLCEICTATGADFVKTSTGFADAGANVEDVKLLRAHCPPSVKVKASGGIRYLEQLLNFCAAGADRIGTSATVAILEEAKKGYDRKGP